MVEQAMSELGVLVIEMESTLRSDMYHHLAGDQAGFIF